MEDSAFCRQSSIAAGEPLVATASAQVQQWLLLEVREPWEAKAVEAAPLPPAVRTALDGWLRTLPRCRPQLIRRPPRADAGPRHVMLASSRADFVARFEIGGYEDLLHLDPPAAFEALERGDVPPGAARIDVPLVLVCTHGKRDACCAKWGRAIYQSAATQVGFEVWQTSHLGGHRFAPTLTVLPLGLSYGRLSPDDVPALLQATARGEVWSLPHFRGRHAFDAWTMAAEHHVRAHTGERDAAVIEPLETLDLDSGKRVRIRVGAAVFRVDLRRTPWHAELLPSCGAAPERPVVLELVALARE